MVPFAQQLGSLNMGQQNTEQVTAAAAVLAKYIRDTGDQEGVVEFLQFMVKSGKVGYHLTIAHNLVGLES